jgi:hypothetical protein
MSCEVPRNDNYESRLLTGNRASYLCLNLASDSRDRFRITSSRFEGILKSPLKLALSILKASGIGDYEIERSRLLRFECTSRNFRAPQMPGFVVADTVWSFQFSSQLPGFGAKALRCIDCLHKGDIVMTWKADWPGETDSQIVFGTVMDGRLYIANNWSFLSQVLTAEMKTIGLNERFAAESNICNDPMAWGFRNYLAQSMDGDEVSAGTKLGTWRSKQKSKELSFCYSRSNELSLSHSSLDGTHNVLDLFKGAKAFRSNLKERGIVALDVGSEADGESLGMTLIGLLGYGVYL